jgi:sec-independent protein translocase protein TatA
MGPVGFPEMVAIFVVALILFGPKKLPELGRMVGKGIREFRRASEELKSTFDREMRNLEQEVTPVKNEISKSFYHDESYNYDYSSYTSDAYTQTEPALIESSASAPQGADSTSAEAHPDTPAGAIANETLSASGGPVRDYSTVATSEPAEHHS